MKQDALLQDGALFIQMKAANQAHMKNATTIDTFLQFVSYSPTDTVETLEGRA